jgi:hypothetical protein
MNKSLRARLLGSPDYVHETRCPAKERRHASKRAFLMKVRKLLGLTAPKGQSLQPGDARVYSNMGGPAVEGEVTLRTSTWFVQLSNDFSYGRTEPDRKGGCRFEEMGPNCPIPASCLARPEDLADWIRRQGWVS